MGAKQLNLEELSDEELGSDMDIMGAMDDDEEGPSSYAKFKS